MPLSGRLQLLVSSGDFEIYRAEERLPFKCSRCQKEVVSRLVGVDHEEEKENEKRKYICHPCYVILTKQLKVGKRRIGEK